MAAELHGFDERTARPFDHAFVDGDIAYSDRAPDDDLRQSYFCTACQERVPKHDLAAIFHHRQRGHKPLSSQPGDPVEKLSDQLADAFARAFRPA